MKTNSKNGAPFDQGAGESSRVGPGSPLAEFGERVRLNQQKLRAELKPQYDFIVCGSGSSGSVVARRLAENADVRVLLVEAGGSDDTPEVMEAWMWPLNLGTERDSSSNPYRTRVSIAAPSLCPWAKYWVADQALI